MEPIPPELIAQIATRLYQQGMHDSIGQHETKVQPEAQSMDALPEVISPPVPRESAFPHPASLSFRSLQTKAPLEQPIEFRPPDTSESGGGDGLARFVERAKQRTPQPLVAQQHSVGQRMTAWRTKGWFSEAGRNPVRHRQARGPSISLAFARIFPSSTRRFTAIHWPGWIMRRQPRSRRR